MRYAARLAVWGLLLVFAGLLLWRPALRLLYPYPYRGVVERAAAIYDVDPILLIAIMRHESHFDIQALSSRGARGLMQIMPETAEWAAEQIPLPGFSVDELSEPVTNVTIGAWYVQFLFRLFDGRAPVVLAAYNAGPGSVQRWLAEGIWTGSLDELEAIPYPETRRYVERVTGTYRLYRIIYQGEHPGYKDLLP